MVVEKRWKVAQGYERSYWRNVANLIASKASGQLDWYQWKADQMEKFLGEHFKEDRKRNARVLEIGSGPIGIVTYLKWGERYTIDPLEDFYRSSPVLSSLRTPAVHYGSGQGEKLPFEDGHFSLVILDNVLDHVHNASGVLDEIHRVMSKDGVLYLAVNLHTSWGGFLHSILSKLLIDRGHPYTFTAQSIRDFIQKHRFQIISELINDYDKAKMQDLKSVEIKDKIKGYAGLSEFVYHSVSSKS